ncbi:Conserved_hypothetical protein [Hexamita inflata]|uniref:Uncharacterized protein n=1 Tax=Hexamita inflata TaxID=28002 RepID=A0AA86RHK1_9EUKA|nr:Conserved hypothetical protein [Hexamita inflata]
MQAFTSNFFHRWLLKYSSFRKFLQLHNFNNAQMRQLMNTKHVTYIQLQRTLKKKATRREKLSSLKQYDNDIQNNIFSIRDHNTLYSLKFIDKLQNITDNTKVTVKNCELLNFDEVPTKIEDLTIESCSIENLEGIQQMKQLKALTISKNQLENTDLSQLYYMKKLNYLNLSSNQLGDNQSLFQNQLEKQLSNLTILDLKDNKITKVPSFQCMQFLMMLNLSCNNISDISPLYSNNNLQTLIIEDNKIISLNHRTAQHNILQNLQVLSLQRNSLIDITDLKYIISLTHLDLSDNQIIDIKPLQCLVNMQYLNLDRNRIFNIWPLKYLTLLEELTFSYNSIVDIHVFKYLNVLNIVKLNYNEVHDVSVLNNRSLELVEARSNFIQDFNQVQVKSSTLQSQMRDDALLLQANVIQRIFHTNDLLQNVRDKKMKLNSQKFRNKIDKLMNEAVRSQIAFTIQYKILNLDSIMIDIEREVQNNDQKIINRILKQNTAESSYNSKNIFTITNIKSLYSLKFVDYLKNIDTNSKIIVKECDIQSFDKLPNKIICDLTLDSCSIDNLEGIQNMKQLKVLSLKNNRLSNADLSTLYNMKLLNDLNLSCNSLSDNKSLFQTSNEQYLNNISQTEFLWQLIKRYTMYLGFLVSYLA